MQILLGSRQVRVLHDRNTISGEGTKGARTIVLLSSHLFPSTYCPHSSIDPSSIFIHFSSNLILNAAWSNGLILSFMFQRHSVEIYRKRKPCARSRHSLGALHGYKRELIRPNRVGGIQPHERHTQQEWARCEWVHWPPHSPLRACIVQLTKSSVHRSFFSPRKDFESLMAL